MTSKKRKAKSSNARQPAKRRTLSEKLADPIWRTESEKSPLVHEDLHALYSNPGTYENWTKEDWEAARRECLPEDAPFSEDGYSVPMEYFRYNVDWRRYVREFQEDLGAGRMDPEWQRQALQAMEERARGDYDEFKNGEFEEFWGQKQKTNSRELAGESAQIKLEDLLKHNVLRVGDIISYGRVFGKSKDRIMVEKEVKITMIDKHLLTVAIPPGQLKYARILPTPEPTPKKGEQQQQSFEAGTTHTLLQTSALDPGVDTRFLNPEQEHKSSECGDSVAIDRLLSETKDAPTKQVVKTDQSAEPLQAPVVNSSETLEATATGLQPPSIGKELALDEGNHDSDELNPPTDMIPSPAHLKGCGSDSSNKVHTEAGQPDVPLQKPAELLQQSEGDVPAPEPATETPQNLSDGLQEYDATDIKTSQTDSAEDVILVQVQTLTELEKKIVEIDGQVPMSTYKSINSWKAMRGKRDNQDMGSLFDMREDFYVHTSPTIVKEPKRTRGGREVKPMKKW